jgi:hypothetical protein
MGPVGDANTNLPSLTSRLPSPPPPRSLASQTLKGGSGPAVVKGDTVTVHATGTVEQTMKKFWSTKARGGRGGGRVCEGRSDLGSAVTSAKNFGCVGQRTLVVRPPWGASLSSSSSS